MKLHPIFPALTIFTMIVSCSNPGAPEQTTSWKESFEKELIMFGHRNWILVLDKAFPEQTSEGISYYYADEDLLPVLQYVLNAVDSSDHISPVLYTDLELEYLDDELIGGISDFKAERENILKDREFQPLLHEKVFGMIDSNAETFRTIAIKTNCTLPYTSFFIRLDCGYWDHVSQLPACHFSQSL